MRRISHLWIDRSPAAKLAAAYVAIIMVISLCFSVVLYHISASQLQRSLRREYLSYRPFFYNELTPSDSPPPMRVQDELDTGTARLEIQLLYFNVVILVLASVASYWLAKRTLRPIEESLEAQSRFTADASHELRTPLAAMQSEIEVALRDHKLTALEAKQLLASNLEEVAKLKALSDGLLRLAREEGNGLTLESVSLAAVVGEAIGRVAKAAKARSIVIENQATTLCVPADRQSLTDLAVILLDNAIKYSPPHSSIEISTKQSARVAQLKVTDHGLGIKASDLPHIFDRFYRADPSRAKDRVEGYGLGLSIARKIAEVHHGTIEVSSNPGRGSVFTVKLPLS